MNIATHPNTPPIHQEKLIRLVSQEVNEASASTMWESSNTCIGEWIDAEGFPVQLQICIQKDEDEFVEAPQPQHSVFFADQTSRDPQLAASLYRERVAQLQGAGLPALQRLLTVAQRDTGQAWVIAKFLLGLYNDRRFPFPLTDLRRIDDALFEDCMAVLRMDARACQKEVHCYVEDGGRIWEQLAKDWRLRDHSQAYQP